MASETLAKIDRAYDVMSALCEGKREWLMSIPARPDHDPDLIIGDALMAARNEIARLTRELEEAREEVAEWVQAAIEYAADLLAERRHGESAPDALMAIRHEVAEWVEAEMGKLATSASDGTTRWYCEYGCGCVLDSRAARYHDCRTPSGERPVIHIPDDAEYRDDGSVHWRVRLPAGAASGEVRERVGAVLRRWNRLAGDVEGSDGPLTETEIAAISRDVAAALRSTPTGETEGDRALWSEVDVRLSVLERLLYAEEGDSPDYRAVVSLRDRVLMKLRAPPTDRSEPS